jgi:transposase
VLHRWNADGPAGLTDRRKANGSKPRLTDAQRGELLAALKKRPPDDGLWTGPKVARSVRDRWGVAVWPQTGWRWLKDLGFTLQVPRPQHPRSASPAARRRWGEKPPPAAGPAATASPR